MRVSGYACLHSVVEGPAISFPRPGRLVSRWFSGRVIAPDRSHSF